MTCFVFRPLPYISDSFMLIIPAGQQSKTFTELFYLLQPPITYITVFSFRLWLDSKYISFQRSNDLPLNIMSGNAVVFPLTLITSVSTTSCQMPLTVTSVLCPNTLWYQIKLFHLKATVQMITSLDPFLPEYIFTWNSQNSVNEYKGLQK